MVKFVTNRYFILDQMGNKKKGKTIVEHDHAKDTSGGNRLI